MTSAAELSKRATFPSAGTAVDLAVSGGSDSVGLTLLALAADLRPTLHHVNHHLRAASDDDARFVRDFGARHGLAVEVYDVEVGEGPNLEARARAARRAVLPPGTMTGHTMDDVAETLLLNLLRGTGIDGVGAMSNDPTKPLIALRRAEVAAVVRAAGDVPRIDESNADLRLKRNDVRARLVPLLNDLAERDVVPLLARQAAVAGVDREWLDDLVAEERGGLADLDCRELARWSRAKRWRWLRRELRTTAPDGWHPPSLDEVVRADAVVCGEVTATELSGGRRLARSGQRLTITPLPLKP